METKDKFYLKIIDQQIADAKKTRNFMEVARLERSRQVIKQYNQQELDALLEEYFPDEIEEIVHENDVNTMIMLMTMKSNFLQNKIVQMMQYKMMQKKYYSATIQILN